MKIFSNISSRWLSRLRKLFFPSKKFVYVALGDSLAEGVGASHHTKSYPSIVFEKIKKDKEFATFHNLGKGGAVVRDVLKSQLDRAVELDPDLVTITVGANDLRTRTRLRHFEEDFSTIIKTLRDKTDARIIVSNIPDVSLAPSLPFLFKFLSKFVTHRLNRSINRHAKEFKFHLLDLYSGSKEYARKHTGLISEDGLHPSDKGYALWANAIIALL